MSHLRLRFLGPPQIELEGKPIAMSRRKSLAILVYLAATGQSQRRDTLATLFWPESNQGQARSSLRRELWDLNQVLGEAWLATERETVRLCTEAGIWIDVEQFETDLAGLEEVNATAIPLSPLQIAQTERAVDLYRGDFLTGFTLTDCPAFDDWQFFQAQTYRQMLAMALDRLVTAHQNRDKFETALPYARRRLALDPLHEPAHRQLILLYARLGQWAAAQRQYEECERILDEELGAPPEPATVDLHTAIRQRKLDPRVAATTPVAVVDAGDIPSPSAPLAIVEPLPNLPPRPRHNIPSPLVPLFGRVQELAALTDLLANRTNRLVTITGAGGMGKTRLAQAVGMAVLASYPDGVVFVPLASLRRSQDMVTALAEALDFPFQPGPRSPQQQILDYLRNKQLLLVLDNFEHLLDGSALVEEILAVAPAVVVLVTSRARLKLTGEALFGLTGIDYAGARNADHSDAVRLFLHSAQLVRADYQPGNDDLSYIDHICRTVQGMPLGILLAAAWMEILSPQEIAEQIGHSLDFLEADLQDLPARQRSLRTVFEHSWQLLAEDEQQVLAHLTVFQGSFHLKAAQAVAHASLHQLMALVRKSLLVRTPDDRFEMHELLRQYAAEQLAQTDGAQHSARTRHAEYYLSWLHALTQDLYSPQQQTVMEAIEHDRENVRLAWEQGTSARQWAHLIGALHSLGRFYEWYGRYQEGADAFQQAAQALAGDDSASGRHARARLLVQQARLQRLLGRRSLAEELLLPIESLLEPVRRAGPDVRSTQASFLRERAELLLNSDKKAATALARASLEMYKAIGDKAGTAAILFVMGVTAWNAGQYDEAASLFRESLSISRELNTPREMAYTLSWLGFTVMGQGQTLAQAEPLIQESYTLFQKIGDRPGLARSLRDLGGLRAVRGDFAGAQALVLRSRAAYAELGDMGNVIETTEYVLEQTVNLGSYAEARRQTLTALPTARAANQTRSVGAMVEVLGQVALAEDDPHEAYNRLLEAAQIYEACGGSWSAGVLYAKQALAARRLGSAANARAHIVHALEHALQGAGWFQLGAILGVAALLKADEGEVVQALELDALIQERAIFYPQMAGSRWWWDVACRELAALAEQAPDDVATQAAERGRSLDIKEVAAELLAENAQSWRKNSPPI